jgi:hypothetical protein
MQTSSPMVVSTCGESGVSSTTGKQPTGGSERPMSMTPSIWVLIAGAGDIEANKLRDDATGDTAKRAMRGVVPGDSECHQRHEATTTHLLTAKSSTSTAGDKADGVVLDNNDGVDGDQIRKAKL